MQIQEATIHRLIKNAEESGEGSVHIQTRPNALPVDEVLQTVCTDLLELYRTSANNYGTLGQDPTLHLFPLRLGEYLSLQRTFQSFTEETLKLIRAQMESSVFSNGGYALFLRYQHDSNDFLLIAMLKLKPGAGINEDTLSLEPTLNIDLTHLHEAARVNLTKMATLSEPYLSFIKGRRKKGEVTEYFRVALACQNFTSSSTHTALVIQAAEAYHLARTDFASDDAKRDARILMRQRIVECFTDNSDEVVLETLSAAINPREPREFLDFVRSGPHSEQYPINDTFKPDKATYKKLRRFNGKIGSSVSVGFEVTDIQQERVYYDEAADGLVLKNPPQHLIQAIREYAPSTDGST